MNLYSLLFCNLDNLSSFGEPQHLYNDINEAHKEAGQRNTTYLVSINRYWKVIERVSQVPLCISSSDQAPSSSNYIMSSDSNQIYIDNLTPAITITLPSPTTNYTISVKE